MSESPSKKHKKHKKHKHKKHHDPGEVDELGDLEVDYLEDGEQPDEEIDVISPAQPAIKLKIKLGSPTVGTTSNIKKNKEKDVNTDMKDPNDLDKDVDSTQWEEQRLNMMKGDDIFMTKKPGEDTSDEEREWLDALEAGTLDDSGALSKKKDISLMTARQRALVHGIKPEDTLMQLPSGYKTEELTEEQLQRRQVRAKKRREMAVEKQEKDKRQTLDRLLKKQEAKLKGSRTRNSRRMHGASYRYSIDQNMISISVPPGYQFPFPSQKALKPSDPKLCGVARCSNMKKYNCSKTGVPLCSLECYKINLANVQSEKVQIPIETG